MNTTPFYDFWARFFAQPLAEKMKHLRQPGRGGYYPANTEQPGYTGTPDAKEYVHVRTHHLDDDAFGEDWNSPTGAVFSACLRKADEWCREHGFVDLSASVRTEDCVLRIIHYPPNKTGNVGQAHVDFDLLTVSVPGTCPGLEVWDPPTPVVRNLDTPENRDFWEHSRRAAKEVATWPEWKRAGVNGGTERPDHWHQRESFEVHVGEMLQEYTRGDLPCNVMHTSCGHVWGCRHHDQKGCSCQRSQPLKATPHRVRTLPNTERFKAVFFYLPPMDFELRPGFTAGDYLYGPNGVLVKAGTAKVGVK